MSCWTPPSVWKTLSFLSYPSRAHVQHSTCTSMPQYAFRLGRCPAIPAGSDMFLQLVGRPVMDDNALFSYMNARYQVSYCPRAPLRSISGSWSHQGDTQSCAVDLILASFDILANAVFRHDGEKDAHLLRSYLINKVPLLLGQLCPRGFSNISAEFCITEALNQVDTTMFPTASLMFDESRETNQYTESVREEFCAACALHGLVEREHVDRILGEVSMSYEPSLEKYSTDKLVQNCLSDPDRIQGLIRELDKMDGNVGAVARALVEVSSRLFAFSHIGGRSVSNIGDSCCVSSVAAETHRLSRFFAASWPRSQSPLMSCFSSNDCQLYSSRSATF